MDNNEYQALLSQRSYWVNYKCDLENKINSLNELIYDQKDAYNSYLEKNEEVNAQKEKELLKVEQMESLCSYVKFISGYLETVSDLMSRNGTRNGSGYLDSILLKMEGSIADNERKLSEYQQEATICNTNINTIDTKMREINNG